MNDQWIDWQLRMINKRIGKLRMITKRFKKLRMIKKMGGKLRMMNKRVGKYFICKLRDFFSEFCMNDSDKKFQQWLFMVRMNCSLRPKWK